MSKYPKQAREIARIVIDLVDNGPYNAPDEAILAMLDGDEREDTRLHNWFQGDPATRYEVYTTLDKKFGIDDEYATSKANQEYPTQELHDDGRFPEPQNMNEKAKIKFYYGVYDLMQTLVEEEFEN